MHLPVRGEQGLAGGQVHHVHAQGHEQTAITRVVVGQQPDQVRRAFHGIRVRGQPGRLRVLRAGRDCPGGVRGGDARAHGGGSGVVVELERVPHGTRGGGRVREPREIQRPGEPFQLGPILLAREQPHG